MISLTIFIRLTGPWEEVWFRVWSYSLEIVAWLFTKWLSRASNWFESLVAYMDLYKIDVNFPLDSDFNNLSGLLCCKLLLIWVSIVAWLKLSKDVWRFASSSYLILSCSCFTLSASFRAYSKNWWVSISWFIRACYSACSLSYILTWRSWSEYRSVYKYQLL